MKSKFIPLAIALVGILCFASSFFIPSASSGELDVQIDKTSFIMPAAHKVYANPDALNGKYYLFKAKLTNNTGKTLEDVTVRYQVPGYIDWTELTVSGQMFPGQTLVVPCYPKFKNNITEKASASIEKAQIEISWNGASNDDVVEEEFSFNITDRNDFLYTGIAQNEILNWSDGQDNNNLMACFVTPNDPVVKYYTQIVQEKVMKGEATVFSSDPKDAIRFIAGIYEATLMTHMVYSGAGGMPQSLDDVASFSQQFRLPREVITGNTGLCIELSYLYASMIAAAGLDPVIFLVPGHAYPGIKFHGQYIVIEATGINGEGLGGIDDVQTAYQKGQNNLKTFFEKAQQGDPRYQLLDIKQLIADGVVPMDLGNDDFMKGKVDKLAENFMPSKNTEPTTQYVAASNQGGDKGGNTINVPPTNTTPKGTNALSFSQPSNWQVFNRPNPDMPILTAQVVSPDQLTVVSVYDVPVGSLQEAMQTIDQYFSMMGLQAQYQIKDNTVAGLTTSSSGTFNWVGKGLTRNGGIRIVAVGSPDYAYNQKTNEISTIFNSIR